MVAIQFQCSHVKALCQLKTIVIIALIVIVKNSCGENSLHRNWTIVDEETCDTDSFFKLENVPLPVVVDEKMALHSSSIAHHYVKTLSGVQMPKLIYGTAWKKERTADLVVQAIRAGYRGVDTACQPKHYYEPGVGQALKILAAEDDIKREDLFIQTKFTSISGQDPKTIPYNPKDDLQTTVKQSLKVSLQNLGTTYIDSLVMHSPMRSHRDTMEVWQVFEEFVDSGQVRQLGISNCYSLNSFKKIFDEARIKPSVLQNRFYAEENHDTRLRKFCKDHGVYYQSFWTLTGNPQLLSNPKVREIAQKYKKTSPQILFAYLIQTGIVTPLTGTTSLQHMKEDLESLDLKLNDEEMQLFDSFVNY